MTENIFNNSSQVNNKPNYNLTYDLDNINQTHKQSMDNNNIFNYFTEITNQIFKNNPNLGALNDFSSNLTNLPLIFPPISQLQSLDPDFLSLNNNLIQSINKTYFSEQNKFSEKLPQHITNSSEVSKTLSGNVGSNDCFKQISVPKPSFQVNPNIKECERNFNNNLPVSENDCKRYTNNSLNNNVSPEAGVKNETGFFQDINEYIKNEMKRILIEIFLKYIEVQGYSIAPVQRRQQEFKWIDENIVEKEPSLKVDEKDKDSLIIHNEDYKKRNKDILKCPHKNRKHYAKNMCSNCYRKKGRMKKAWLCQHVNKSHYARGKCQNCYLYSYQKEQKEAKRSKKLKIVTEKVKK